MQPTLAILLDACASLPSWLNHLHVAFFDISISNFLNSYGYVVVFLFIAIESTGIPFPGETMLLAASVYAAQGCGLREPLVIVACILGATSGDNLGFWVGRTGGRNLIRKYGKYVRLRMEHLEPAEAFFRRYGGATVFFGRFLAILRAWAAFLAGVNNMNPIRFFLYNLSGAILWSTTFGLLGYLLGKNLNRLKSVVETLGVIGAIVAAVIVAILIGALLLRRRRAHAIAREHDHSPGDPGAGPASATDQPPAWVTPGAAPSGSLQPIEPAPPPASVVDEPPAPDAPATTPGGAQPPAPAPPTAAAADKPATPVAPTATPSGSLRPPAPAAARASQAAEQPPPIEPRPAGSLPAEPTQVQPRT